jgi:hypothetical protein
MNVPALFDDTAEVRTLLSALTNKQWHTIDLPVNGSTYLACNSTAFENAVTAKIFAQFISACIAYSALHGVL